MLVFFWTKLEKSLIWKKISKTQESEFKGRLSGLRQFLATENHLKLMKNVFYFTLTSLFILKISEFLSWRFGQVWKAMQAMILVTCLLGNSYKLWYTLFWKEICKFFNESNLYFFWCLCIPFDDYSFAACQVRHLIYLKEHIEKLAVRSGGIKQHWTDDISSSTDVVLKQCQVSINTVGVRGQVINV